MANPPTSDPELWVPPVQLCSAINKESFAYESTAKRWPSILTNLIASLEQASFALSYSSKDQSAKIAEADQIVQRVQQLLQDIKADAKLVPIQGGPETDGGVSTKETYDTLIEKEKWSWYTAPWLFAECYLYRLLRSFFSKSTHWKEYDPFSQSKISTFRSSGTAIRALAENLQTLVNKSQAQQGKQEDVVTSEEARHILFLEMAQISLWGNATDLSLLTSLSYDDIQKLQTTGKEQQEARAKYILSNDLERAWQKVRSLKGGRVDFVLDNSGFELVSDLVFADWLLTTPYVSQVVFHPKNIPWFVSDVTPPDFRFTIDALLSDGFFEGGTAGTSEQQQEQQEQRAAASALRNRSASRNREMRADASLFEGAQALPHPKGSRSLQYTGEQEAEKKEIPHPPGSSQLQMKLDANGKPIEHPKGSMSLQLDPAYFKNARSRTVSPSRSYVIDSAGFASFTLEDGAGGKTSEARGRTVVTDGSPARARSTSAQRGRSGFRSFGAADESIPEDAEVASNAEEDQRGRSFGRGPAGGAAPTSVQQMAARWQSHLKEGRFKLSVPHATTKLSDAATQANAEAMGYWTTPYSFADLPKKDAKLLAELRKSDLVIFKGDLNYRKLTSDGNWPHDTPFAKALGPLAGTINLLALRTCKADVCVGLTADVAQRVAKEDPKWQTNGKWAVVQFLEKSS